MTLNTIYPKPTAGQMADGKLYNVTYTTTAAAAGAYEVMGTFNIAGFIAVSNTISVTTNDLLFKFEFSRDGGITWNTSIEDYPIAAAASASLSAVRTAIMYRVSVKPAVAGNHGTADWTLIATNTVVPPEYRSAFAYESITVSNAHAEKFTVATMGGAFRANVTVEDNPIRVRWDGTDPTTSEGHLLQSGDSLILDFTADLYHFRAIATGGDAKIRVTYSR